MTSKARRAEIPKDRKDHPDARVRADLHDAQDERNLFVNDKISPLRGRGNPSVPAGAVS